MSALQKRKEKGDEMYRILVVDDERIERNGIKMLLKRFFAKEMQLEVFEAANGKTALEFLERQPVDILITDVKMPFMDGIELIQTIAPKRREMKIAIFSGYSEFEYAKIAMQYGVKNYILKPVDPKEFQNTILSMTEELEKQKEDQLQKDKQNNFMKEYILYSLINGVSAEEIERKTGGILECKMLESYQKMFLIEFDREFFGKTEEDFNRYFQEMLEESVFYLNLNPQQAIVLRKEGKRTDQETAEMLSKFFQSHYGKNPYIAVSRKLSSIEDFSVCLDELEALLERRFYRPDIHTYLSEQESVETGRTHSVQVPDDDILTKQIHQDLKMKDLDSLKEHVACLEEKYYMAQGFSQVYVKFIFSNILKDFYEELPSKSEKDLTKDIEQLYRAITLNEIMDVVKRNLKDLEAVFGQSKTLLHKEIESIKQYIYDHYGEELSVEMLAEKVYMAPSYLSHIFKKETGLNLSRFIKNYRMEMAKKKLETTHEKIVTISYSVGYQNVSYFCQNFREYFGVTPQKFRG